MVNSARCLTTLIIAVILSVSAYSQSVSVVNSSAFKIGEKLSYTVSFQNLKDVAILETSVVSQGKLSGRDVVEIRGRLKTFDLVSAAFSFVDESRTVFADPETGYPVVINRTTNGGPIPKETTINFLTAPATSFDLLTAIYAIRNGNGNGSFPIIEDGETSILTAQTGKTQKIKSVFGEYDTNVSKITGTYLDARGIKQLSVYFSIDDARLPVVIEFKTAKGTYTAQLSSVENIVPEVTSGPTPTPTPKPVTTPVPTPTPKATPAPYVPNQPLLPELSFALGETLEYKVSSGGRSVGTIRFSAAERKLFQKREGLRLTATVTGTDQGNSTFTLGDSMTTIVNPDTLAPFQSEMKFAGSLARLNQAATFDTRTGLIAFGGANSIEAPVGTHTILSLIYAMRSFNLRPSKDLGNRVNDTRVAVFWNDRPYIFTLRPSNADSITNGGEKVAAQLITINTGNAELDQLGLKVWLSMDERRVPLRFSVGTLQANLSVISNSLIK